MKVSKEKKPEVAQLPRHEATFLKIFGVLDKNDDFSSALSPDARDRLVTARRAFVDDTNPDNDDFIVQIILKGKRGSDDFRWMAFHWHRVFGTDQTEGGVELPTYGGNGLFPDHSSTPFNLEIVPGWESGPNVVLSFADLDTGYMEEQFRLRDGLEDPQALPHQ